MGISGAGKGRAGTRAEKVKKRRAGQRRVKRVGKGRNQGREGQKE
jgi:hypothetical protein